MRFFLHMRDGDEFIEDLEGIECGDLAMAHAEAVQGVREILAERLRQGKVIDGQKIEIHDESGHVLESFLFRDVVYLS